MGGGRDVFADVGQEREGKVLRPFLRFAIGIGSRHPNPDYLNSGGFYLIIVVSQLGQPRIAVGTCLAIEEDHDHLSPPQITLELHKLGLLIVEFNSWGESTGTSPLWNLIQ